MAVLSPAEREEVGVALGGEIVPLPADQRGAFPEVLGSGFFPPRVVAGVEARLGAS